MLSAAARQFEHYTIELFLFVLACCFHENLLFMARTSTPKRFVRQLALLSQPRWRETVEKPRWKRVLGWLRGWLSHLGRLDAIRRTTSPMQMAHDYTANSS